MAAKKPPAPPLWMSYVLGASAVGLIILIGIVAARIGGATAPVCNPLFPARISSLPSYWYVFTAIAAFALGHAVGQVGIRRQKLPETELGKGSYDGRSAAVAVNAGVAIFLLVVTILLGIEAWTLGHGVWPITYYTRCSTDASPLLALLGSAIFAFVIGRWMWVFTE